MLRISTFTISVLLSQLHLTEVAFGQAETLSVVDWIDQLVSKNPASIIDRNGHERHADGFDREKEMVVYRARAELVRLGPKAIPFLIERWDDDRFCLTIESALSGWHHNHTVGEECSTIVFDQLQPYGVFQKGPGDRRSKPVRPNYPRTFLDSQAEAKKWWEKHKDESLVDLQLMVVQWIMDEEANRPKDFAQEEKDYLVQFQEDLMKSKKAVKWGNYQSSDREAPTWRYDFK